MKNKEVKIGDLRIIGNTLFVINKVDDQMFYSSINFELINNKINFGERCSFCHGIGREPKESEIQEFFFSILDWYNKKYCVVYIKDYLSDSDYFDISDRVSYHLNLETNGDAPYCQLIYDIRDYIWNNITEEDVSIKRITDINDYWIKGNEPKEIGLYLVAFRNEIELAYFNEGHEWYFTSQTNIKKEEIYAHINLNGIRKPEF